MAASLVGLAVAWGGAQAQQSAPVSNWRPPESSAGATVGSPGRASGSQTSPKALPVMSFDKPAGANASPTAPTLWPQLDRVVLQQPGPAKPPSPQQPPADQAIEYQLMIEMPGMERLFRLDSEAALFERMQQEARQRSPGERLNFPDEKPVTTQPFVARSFAPMQLSVEPHYVCYDRLYFEDKNSERYGWDLGFIQPAVSAAMFYKDLALWPYHAFTDPCRRYECSAGYCLPGDPVPYLWYPPQWSLTGLVAEAGTAIGLAFAFP